MKTLLNLKGLCRSSQLAVNPDSQPTVNRRSRLMSIICLFLLTLGVGQMWADTTFADGDVLFYDFSDVTGGGGVNWQCNESDMVYDPSGAGTIKCVIFTSSTTWNTSWTVAKTAKGEWANINMPSDRPDGKNCLKINADGKAASWTTISLAEKVAKGDLIMVYGGELSSWNQSKYYFIGSDNNTTDNTKAFANANKAITLDGEAYKLGPVALPSGSYIQGHWNSDLSCSLQAGFAYVVRGSITAANHTQKDVEHDKDYLYEVSADGTHTATRTVTTTIDESIEQGSSISVTTTAPSPSYSVVGATNTIEYYLYDGSSWSPLTVDAGVADVSSLPAGTDYKIATLLKDANGLYVRADLDEFDVYDTWAMYSGDTKIADFTTTDGVHYSITDLVIDNDNNANTNYRSSCNANPAQAGALSLLVNEASARALSFDNGRIAWQDGNGTFNIYIVNNGGWKIYASKTAGVEEWYWIEGNGAHTGSEAVTKQSMELTAVSGVYSCTRSLTENQTFHFGNTINGYWPKSPSSGSFTGVTTNSTNIQLAGGGSTYWFQFTSATQPVVMTLNTNTNPYTISFSNPVYTITYQDQGGLAYSGSNGSALPTSHTYGTETPFVNGEKSGYRFDGWYTDAACTARAGSSIGATAITANTTYYAKWIGYSYTVRFNANGGSGSMDNETGFVYGTNKALTANAFTRPGYTFSGWATATDGEKVYDNSQSVSILPASDGATIDLYAVWTERPYKIVYFAKPADWDHVYAYAWSGGTNNTWPGVQLDGSVAGTGTVTVNCATYYYYKFYTDGGADDAVATAPTTAWTNVIFNNGVESGSAEANKTKTSDLTIVDGNYYGIHTGMQGTSASGYSTSAKWTLRGSFNTWSAATYPFSCVDDAHTYSVSVTGLTASTSYDFKIYGPDQVAYKYTGGKDAAYNDKYDITSLLDGRDLILNEYSSNNNSFTAATTSYTFTIDVTDPKHPVLTVVSGDEANYSATLQAGAHGHVTNAGAVTLHRFATTSITATPEPGYRFLNWTSTGGGTVEFGNANSATTTVTATADGATITANFTNEGFIYLDKSAIQNSWSGTPYVYFYSGAYWDKDGKGSGSLSGGGVTVYGPYAMTRIGDSQIWYYDYSTTPGSGTTKQYVAFNDHSQSNYNNFASCQAIYRGDFYPGMSMLVVRDWKSYYNKCAYFQEGYWRKYNDTDPGYVVKIYNGYANGSTCNGTYALRSDIAGSRNCTVDVPLNSGTNYFKIEGCDTTTVNGVAYAGTYYRDGSNGTMNSDNNSNWLLTDKSGSNTGVLATASSDYTFTLTLGEGQMFVSVDFPLAVGDFRMVYNGKMRSTYVAKKDHPSNFIRKLKAPTVATDTTRKDTLSFYVDPVTGDLAPEIRFQWCSKIEGYTITWRDTLADVKPVLSSITKAGVYNFEVTQTTTKADNHSISCALLGAYNGNYYIRTDKAAGGWKTYKEVKDNQLVYSDVSRQYDFDYYYCNWFNAGDNVKFTIANDYNECVTDTVENDTYVTETGGNAGKLSYSANIRFMFNDSTNVISRAYINGAGKTANNRFLVLTGDAKTFNNDEGGTAIAANAGKNLEANELEFDDQNNWVYQVELKAQSDAKIKVSAKYNTKTNYFIGSPEAGVNLISSTDSETKYSLRVVYDFKTNHLVTAWLPPTTEIRDQLSITADMMLIRHGQNAAQELTFNGGSIKNIHTMIGAMEFRRDSIVGHVGSFTDETSDNKTYRYMMYYISFPFDVAVQDIYGCGQFNREWYLQYYDGADRAAKGFFRGDGTITFWKFMSLTDTLKAGTGYSLLLDNDYFNTAGENVWTNNPDKVYLYFPSASPLHKDSIISSATKTLKVPSHECRHDRTFLTESGREVNHKFTDSHWNMMGVPLFQNYNASIASFAPGTSVDSTAALAEGKGYFYDWSPVNNTFTIHAADDYQFKSMHGYMVQFYGSVSFTGSAIHTKPSPVVARRTPQNREDYTLELQLLRNNNRISRTYIELREEACDTFVLNEDVYMIYTSLPADLYTYAGNYDVSANVLSIDNHVVPVGVEVHQAGEYTFAMPDNFSGSAVLVDTEANTRTNLAISDYTVTLPKGVCDGRFFLELDIRKVPTAIDGVTDGNGSLKDGKAHKFIENGAMYILRDGQVFDARGNRLQ